MTMLNCFKVTFPRRSHALLTTAAALGICLSLYSGQVLRADSKPASKDVNSNKISIHPSPTEQTVVIPGPLQSLERMAGISPKVSSVDFLPTLARQATIHGYEGSHPTEYLILVQRYLKQARELQNFAGPTQTIRVNGCNDAGPLIEILGYRMRQGCGQKTFSLETANPERAFITIDSGFPLVQLEEALQSNTPFVYPYPSSPVPILFTESDWAKLKTGQKRTSGALVDVLLSDRFVSRLYYALAREDSETLVALRQSPGLQALLPFAPVLDFYGNQISIHSGRVAVPGGTNAEAGWKELVGASPDSPGHFVLRLISKDKGWLAAYFDTLSRVNQEQQAHLTQSPRLRRVYDALRSFDANKAATEGVFRRSPNLLVLFSRVTWDSNGDPHVPGGLDVWKDLLHRKLTPKTAREWDKRAHIWDSQEQFFEGMTALSRVETDIGTLPTYLMALEIDRNRPASSHLTPEALRVMASKFTQLNSWYPVFAEFPALDDTSIIQFVNTADSIDKISNRTLRANVDGSFQALLGLWQILARQGQIAPKDMNASWIKIIQPFSSIGTSVQLLDTTRASLEGLLTTAGGNSKASQEEIVDLLAGPHQDSPEGQRVHQELANRMLSVLDDQRLVSLDTLFALSDGLKQMETTGSKGDSLLPLAAELREFELPRPIFTNNEKILWAPEIYTTHHAELQLRTDLTKTLQGPSSPAKLEAARGQLAPFLRDLLVGLNYAYYEPPGAQMLHHNPLFVRSHDFLGISIQGAERLWGAPMVLGVGAAAGGGAYLMGSLADLPYALATAEEDFIAPKYVQALIWKELVPVLMAGSTLPRWWNITPTELHAVTLYQKSGEEILTAAAGNAQLTNKVLNILSDRMAPQRLEELQDALLRAGGAADILPRIMPAETSYLAEEIRKRFPNETSSWGPASRELDSLRSRDTQDASWDRISRDFGVPHPTLARTNSLELMNGKPFPVFGGDAGRLFAESFESSNLYWARLADELGYSPVTLNTLVPELTRETIANIFATDFDDWPAVLRAMHETGDEFRQRGRVATQPSATTASSRSDQTINTSVQ